VRGFLQNPAGDQDAMMVKTPGSASILAARNVQIRPTRRALRSSFIAAAGDVTGRRSSSKSVKIPSE
jgi:hypothetical protein